MHGNKRSKRERRQKAHALMPPAQKLIFVAGLGIGVTLTVLCAQMYFYKTPHSIERVVTPTRVKKPALAPKPKTNRDTKSPQLKQKYEFYDMLPSLEVQASIPKPVIEKPTLKKEPPNDKKLANQATLNHHYWLQAGAFRRIQEAERLKASLSLQGVPVAIHGFRLNNGQFGFRLSIGPFETETKVQWMAQQLKGRVSDLVVIKK